MGEATTRAEQSDVSVKPVLDRLLETERKLTEMTVTLAELEKCQRFAADRERLQIQQWREDQQAMAWLADQRDPAATLKAIKRAALGADRLRPDFTSELRAAWKSASK